MIEQQVVRNYKDTVFRMLFTEPENALLLYNALNETNYADAGQLEFNTLENAIYMNVKNDLSFLIAHHVNLYEQQSTFNPNMPLRDLFYVADLFQKIVKDKSIYTSRTIKIPNPEFVVFYNGREEVPERMELKLSSMFEIPTDHPSLELKVTMLNINPGMNPDIKEKCPVLGEYNTYVSMVRKFAHEMPIEEAVAKAVSQCIQEGVLREFLTRQKSEVIKMSIYEYDEERERMLIREDERQYGRELGLEEGRKEGEKIGEKIGEENFALLTRKLIEDNRMDDILRITEDKEYRAKLMTEYGILSNEKTEISVS